MGRMMSKRSKAHPSYKTRYHVTNWPECDRALVRRGDLTLWFTPAALRTWTPLPTGESGNILAVELTDASFADATAFPKLLEQVPNPVERLTADGGYDRSEVYEAARKRGAKTVIPPRRDAVFSGEPVLDDRDAHLERNKEIGRRRWRLEAGQHQRARAEFGRPNSVALRR